MTPFIAPLRSFSDGSLGQGGTYGAYLSDIIGTPLPSGIFKILVDGGSRYCAVEVLQFDGPSATTLQVVYDSGITSISDASAAPVRRPDIRAARVASRPKQAFSEPLK